MKALQKGLIYLFLPVVMLFSGCGTREGNGSATLEFRAYSGTSFFTLIRTAHAAVSSVSFCFKRLRFKTEGQQTAPDPEQDSDNIDFNIGEVTLSASGTRLGSVSVPAATYKRIEFDLEDKCTSGKSIRLTNTNGSFSTNQRIKIRFDGTFTMSEADTTLSISVQAILNALDTVSDNSQIRSQAESVGGDF